MPTRSLALPAAFAALLMAFQAIAETPHVHTRPVSPAAAPGSVTVKAAPPAPTASGSYRRFTFDEPLANWRQVNDTVRAIGGWREYAKEAAQANAPTARPPADTLTPQPAPASKEKP